MKRLNTRTRISFGKHKGIRMNELPTDYLEWLVNNIESSKWIGIANKILSDRNAEKI